MILVGCLCLVGVLGTNHTPSKRLVRRPGDVGYVGPGAPQHSEDGEQRGTHSVDDQLEQPCSQKVHQKTPCSEKLSEVPDLGPEAPQAPDEGRAARKNEHLRELEANF